MERGEMVAAAKGGYTLTRRSTPGPFFFFAARLLELDEKGALFGHALGLVCESCMQVADRGTDPVVGRKGIWKTLASAERTDRCRIALRRCEMYNEMGRGITKLKESRSSPAASIQRSTSAWHVCDWLRVNP